jgi:hypothetical protein
MSRVLDRTESRRRVMTTVVESQSYRIRDLSQDEDTTTIHLDSVIEPDEYADDVDELGL